MINDEYLCESRVKIAQLSIRIIYIYTFLVNHFALQKYLQ